MGLALRVKKNTFCSDRINPNTSPVCFAFLTPWWAVLAAAFALKPHWLMLQRKVRCHSVCCWCFAFDLLGGGGVRGKRGEGQGEGHTGVGCAPSFHLWCEKRRKTAAVAYHFFLFFSCFLCVCVCGVIVLLLYITVHYIIGTYECVSVLVFFQ